MPKRKRWVVTSLLLLPLVIRAFPLTSQEKIEDWHYFLDLVQRNYPYFGVQKRVSGTEWSERVKAIEKILLKSNDDLSFYKAIALAATSLQNGHTHIISPSSFPSYAEFYLKEKIWQEAFTADVYKAYEHWQEVVVKKTTYLSFEISYVAGSYYVTKTNNTQVPLLSEVLAVNGKEVNRYVKEDVKTVQKLFDPIHKKPYIKRFVFTGERVELTLKTGGTTTKEVVDLYTQTQPKPNARVQTSMEVLQENQIANVKIPSFSSSLMAEDNKKLRAFYTEIKDYPYLIIDIRGNGGGSDYYWQKNILEPLLKQKIKVNSYIIHREDSFVKRFFQARLGLGNYFLRRSKLDLEKLPALPPEVLTDEFADPVQFSYIVSPRQPVGFKGQVFLLIDEGVYSAAETFAMVAKASGFAYLVGTNTGGDGPGFDPIFFTLPNSKLVIRMSASMGLNPNGAANEEYQTRPDLYVENTPEYYVYRNKDRVFSPNDKQLQAVIELVKNNYSGGEKPTVPGSYSADILEHLFSGVPRSADASLMKYQGQAISEVVIYGAYATDKEKLKKIIDLTPGQKVELAKLRMIEDKLRATGSFSQVAVNCENTPLGVRVKILIKEGFLFFIDPYDAGFTLIEDLTNKTLTAKLFNLRGKLINVSFLTSLPKLDRCELSVSFPAILGQTFQEQLILGGYFPTSNCLIGDASKRYHLQRQFVASSTSRAITPGGRLFLNAVCFNDTFTSLPADNFYQGKIYELSLGQNQILRDFNTSKAVITYSSHATLAVTDKLNLGYKLIGAVNSVLPVNKYFKLSSSLAAGLAYNVSSQRLFTVSNQTLPSYANYCLKSYFSARVESSCYFGNFAIAGGAQGLACQADFLTPQSSYFCGIYGILKYRLPIGVPIEFLTAFEPQSGQSRFSFGFTNSF